MSSGIFLLLDVNMPLRRKPERAKGTSCLPVQTEMFLFDCFGYPQPPSGEGGEEGGAFLQRSERPATSALSACVRDRARAACAELQARSSVERGAHGARPYSYPEMLKIYCGNEPLARYWYDKQFACLQCQKYLVYCFCQ